MVEKDVTFRSDFAAHVLGNEFAGRPRSSRHMGWTRLRAKRRRIVVVDWACFRVSSHLWR